MPASAEELFAWHARSGASERLRPPWKILEIDRPAPGENGGRGLLSSTKWPFSRWVHRHEFGVAATGESLLRDHIDYTLHCGFLGDLVAGRLVARDLDSTFAFRHTTTARDLKRHQRFRNRPPLQVAITGANGLVGSSLQRFLSTGGHSVVPIARARASSTSGPGPHWNQEQGLLYPSKIEPFDAIVHLAGQGIASGRWSQERKARIRDSRVVGTRSLVRTLGELKRPPQTLVCASAIGVYGSRGDQQLDETSTLGRGFLADVCRETEAAALEAEQLGIRVVLLRFGIVLTPSGGALAKMLPAFRLGAGGVLGRGRQSMSWISIDDVIGAIHHTLFVADLSGPVNAVAPGAVTNREFTETLGRVLRRPTLFPLPTAGVRLLFGEMANETLLSSARVVPTKLNQTGFIFDDPELEPTLQRLLGRTLLP